MPTCMYPGYVTDICLSSLLGVFLIVRFFSYQVYVLLIVSMSRLCLSRSSCTCSQPSRVCNECHDMLHSRRQGVIKSRVYSLMTESQATATLTSSIRQQMLDDSAPAFPVYVPPTPKQSQDDGLQREADTRVQNPRAQPSPVVASVPVKTASVASLAGSSRSLLGTDGRTGTASEDDEIIVLEGGDALDGSPVSLASQYRCLCRGLTMSGVVLVSGVDHQVC